MVPGVLTTILALILTSITVFYIAGTLNTERPKIETFDFSLQQEKSSILIQNLGNQIIPAKTLKIYLNNTVTPVTNDKDINPTSTYTIKLSDLPTFQGTTNVNVISGNINKSINALAIVEATQSTSVIKPTCIQNWQCTSWSQCSNGIQTHVCTDANNCGNITGKPSETQTCSVQPSQTCIQNWYCTNWIPCTGNTQTRTCNDINNCGNNTGKPFESQSCTCTPNWICSSWSTCTNNLQNRVCVDQNNCGVTTSKPSESQSCSPICNPNWQCTAWSVCSSGTQTRTCTDSNNCGTTSSKPSESQSCTITQQIYAVQPVIFLASDTNININSYQTQVDSSFATVRDWYAGQLGGKTFNLLPTIVYRSQLTDTQLHDTYGYSTGIWFEGLKQAISANGLNVCDNHRFYYFVSPINNITGGFVGSEHLGCSYVFPGTAAIPDHMGRLIGGIIDPNWPEWWAVEIRQAEGGVAHELGHNFGGDCAIGNYPGGGCDAMPHPAPGQHSIIYEWWEFGTTGILLDGQKMNVTRSPFIS